MQQSSEQKYHITSGYESIDSLEWGEFVVNHPDGTIFQTPEYFQIHQGAKGFTPHVFTAHSNANMLVGVMVVIVSKVYEGFIGNLTARAIIAGGPLVVNNDPEIATALLEYYHKDKNIKVVYSQFRNLFDVTNIAPAFTKLHARYEEHLNIHIDLTADEDSLWQNVKSRRRTSIKQALKKGVTVQRLLLETDIETAYNIIEDLYLRTKLPLADRTLFTNAFQIMHKNGMLRIYGAVYEGQIIGTMFILSYNGRFYDWYAGSLKEFYKYNPNDLLPWEVLSQARAESFRLFDFGGAGKPGVPYGVRDYKIQFGGEFVNFGRYEIAHNRLIFALMRYAFKAWQLFRK